MSTTTNEHDSIQSRRANRHPLKTAVTFMSLDSASNGDTYLQTGVTNDLNLLGFSMFTSSSIEKGQKVRVWILDEQLRDFAKIEGEVAWTRIDEIYGDSPYWVQAGIRFDGLDIYQQSQLGALLPTGTKPTANNKHILALEPK